MIINKLGCHCDISQYGSRLPFYIFFFTTKIKYKKRNLLHSNFSDEYSLFLCGFRYWVKKKDRLC